MNFPCDFALKVMGAMDANLEAAITPILSKHIPDMSQVTISSKPSKGEKFVSLTIKFQAQSQEQLDNIYREISARPDVLMVL